MVDMANTKSLRVSLFTVWTLLSLVALIFLAITPAQSATANHPLCDNSGCYWYVKANLTPSSAPTGVQSSMTVERPVVQGDVAGKAHSLAAMYIASVSNG